MVQYIQERGLEKLNILVIDAQGGGVGKQLIGAIKSDFPQERIIAIGTNAMATAAMLKAGADGGATGENAVVVGCRTADIIVGPMGIVIADSMLGEVTPLMAKAVAQSSAERILIPFNNCSTHIMGVPNQSMSYFIEEAVRTVAKILTSGR